MASDFIPKHTRKKNTNNYRSIYISDDLMKVIEAIAIKNDTSMNNVIISMIESRVNPQQYESELRYESRLKATDAEEETYSK